MLTGRQAAALFAPLLALLLLGVVVVRGLAGVIAPGFSSIQPAPSLRPGMAIPLATTTPTPPPAVSVPVPPGDEGRLRP